MKRVAAIALLAAAPALAQYPDRPIRFIVPQAAGSATDNVVRLLAPEMAKQLNQNVVVENRPGGALTIGNRCDREGAARRLHDRHGAGRRDGDHAAHGRENCRTTSSATCSRSRSSRAATSCSQSRRTPRSARCRT
jgi:hypothetical protein